MKFSMSCACERPHTIFKAASDVPLIDRDRPVIRRQRLKMRVAIKKYLRARAPEIADEVCRQRDKAEKVSVELVARILEALDLGNWDSLTDDVKAQIETILKDAGIEALAQVGISDSAITEVVNERAVEYAKERAAELVKNIRESTRNMLRADIAEAMADGWSNDELRDAIMDNYGFSPERADVIARTETAYADVAGNLEGYRASGVVTRKKWITGAGCCDLCDALNGVTIDLDEDFDTEDGPIDGPPYHPNCRCDVSPVVDTQD